MKQKVQKGFELLSEREAEKLPGGSCRKIDVTFTFTYNRKTKEKSVVYDYEDGNPIKDGTPGKGTPDIPGKEDSVGKAP